MNNDSCPLSLFNVLVEEYEHQRETHDLEPLCDGGGKTEQDFYQRLHESGVKRAALCFSGGGIRSATFGLGALQGLARHVNIDNFHYLSTVSGGGYLGSWFSAWVHRRGMQEVQNGLEGKQKDKSPLKPEPEPIFHLRRYSNYMSPRLGLLSADTWTLVGIYLRNLFLNWLVLIPLMAAALSLPRLWMSAVADSSPTSGWINGIFWGGFISGIIAIAYIIINRPSLADLTQRGGFLKLPQKLRGESSFLWFGLGGLVVTAIASALYWWWSQIPDPTFQERWAFIKFSIALNIVGFGLSQLFAPQIRMWRRYYCGIRDLSYSIVTGALVGLCLWGIAQASQNLAKTYQNDPLIPALYACFAPPLFLLTLLVAGAIFMGLASYHTTDADREWAARAGGWILIAITVWIAVNGLVFFGPDGLIWLWKKNKGSLVSIGTVSGIIALLGGRAGSTSAKQAESEKTKKPGLPVKLLELALPFAAVIFALIFLAMLSLGTATFTKFCGELWQSKFDAIYYTPFRLVFFTLLGFVAVGVLMGFFVNINKFSLHSAYRDRLIRAYLGASRGGNERRPNPFTGLDEQDNLQMHELILPIFSQHDIVDRDNLFKMIVSAQDPAAKPEAVYKFIWSSLSPNTRRLLDGYKTAGDRKKELIHDETMKDLIDSFNRIIHGPPLGRNRAFQKKLEQLAKSRKRYTEFKALENNSEGLEQLEKSRKQYDEFKALQNSPEELAELEKSSKWYDDIQTLINDQQIVPLWTGFLPLRFWDHITEVRWLGTGIKNWRRARVEKLRINAKLLEAALGGMIVAPSDELHERRPLHIINMALNLVKGEELAWQDRKAQSFTASPLHAGSFFDVGYRCSKKYAISRKQSSAISLGTSMAISGAAANPNMGYHSSPVVTFLMTLFNVRLGWWLGNPRGDGRKYLQPSPVFAPKPLIAETLGWTNEKHSYVHLSDGGHFENLGLYEMVLRRCHFIIVIDASQDKDFDFESLGNAMSKIRTDLGISITFDSIPISPREEKIPTFVKNGNGEEEKKKKYCAFGHIRYSEVDGDKAEDGVLIYIKPAIYGAEPADVLAYARANPAFPHESTGDQMYSETQFESYRALGFYEISEIMEGAGSGIELKDLFSHVNEKYLREKITEELRRTGTSRQPPLCC